MTVRSVLVHLTCLGAAAVLAACSSDTTHTPCTGSSCTSSDSGVVADAAPADAAETADSGAPADAGVADTGAVDSGAPDSGSTTAPRCTTPTSVPCTDEQITQLVLFSNLSRGLITTTTTAEGFVSRIDATAGGATPTQSYTYARFTPTGLEKVEISDEQSFDSMDWDIAFRRYIVRVNSGVGGPSCTRVARVPGTTDFASVTAAPSTPFRVEEYFSTDTCDLVPDGSGLPGAAAVALGSYWTYQQCVQMTHNVFVLQLADGHDVKLQVERYYGAANAQATCDRTGQVPMPSGSGNYEIKWAYLP